MRRTRCAAIRDVASFRRNSDSQQKNQLMCWFFCENTSPAPGKGLSPEETTIRYPPAPAKNRSPEETTKKAVNSGETVDHRSTAPGDPLSYQGVIGKAQKNTRTSRLLVRVRIALFKLMASFTG